MVGIPNFHPPGLLVFFLVTHRASLCWKLPRTRSILGVSTHASARNNNNACVTAFKKCPNTFGSAPYWINIHNIRPQLFLTLQRLPTHFRPVIISHHHHPPRVLKLRHIFQQLSIVLKGPICAFPQLRLNEPAPVSHSSPGTLRCGRVISVQCTPGEQHVASGAL